MELFYKVLIPSTVVCMGIAYWKGVGPIGLVNIPLITLLIYVNEWVEQTRSQREASERSEEESVDSSEDPSDMIEMYRLEQEDWIHSKEEQIMMHCGGG